MKRHWLIDAVLWAFAFVFLGAFVLAALEMGAALFCTRVA